MADAVTIVEMSPRDGLQNEPNMVSTPDKIALVNRLSACGFQKIEVASFVSPKWVPQMADGENVLAGISRHPETHYTALTPNMKGFARAQAAGADEVAVFGSASESFSQRNINCSIEESFARFAPILDAARQANLPVRGYVSCVTNCPYEGEISAQAVAKVARHLFEMGCFEISLGDTIGHGTPERVAQMLDAVRQTVPARHLAGHFHDTHGHALDNIAVSLDAGLRVFDASVAGLGGCPYAPGAKGNVATESVAAFLAARGFSTGLDRQALADAARFATGLRSNP